MVLTHLIMNDMMKVKGHIARMALCLQDPHPRIKDLAHLFFHELAQKNYKVTDRFCAVHVKIADSCVYQACGQLCLPTLQRGVSTSLVDNCFCQARRHLLSLPSPYLAALSELHEGVT